MNIPQKSFLWFLFGITCILGGCANPPVENPDPNHIHADFAIWIDNEKLDFSDPKYMSEAPSEEDDHHREEEEGDEHSQYIHFHDENGNMIHLHKQGFTLVEFLGSFGFSMTPSCLTTNDGTAVCSEGEKRWRMFVNGTEEMFDPEYSFHDLDQVLLTYGANDEQIQEQLAALTDDACIYSKTCPERGEAPVENCISDPDLPCIAPPEE